MVIQDKRKSESGYNLLRRSPQRGFLESQVSCFQEKGTSESEWCHDLSPFVAHYLEQFMVTGTVQGQWCLRYTYIKYLTKDSILSYYVSGRSLRHPSFVAVVLHHSFTEITVVYVLHNIRSS